jgi:hypothetical protein
MYGKPTHKLGLYSNIGLGDQTIFWAVSQFRPELHTGLPLSWEVTSCLMVSDVSILPVTDGQNWYGTGQLDDPRMTAEQQIKKQEHLGKTGYDGTLITPGIVSFLFRLMGQEIVPLILATLQLYARQDVYGVTSFRQA